MKAKVGVIGLGFMGFAHARIYNQLRECELVGVCDTDQSKKYLAERYRCKFFKEFTGLLEESDAVSICTPTSSHRQIALEALNEDKHILIEKPLTTNVKDAEEIIERKTRSRILAVAYVERFNPAVKKLREIVDLSQIYSTVSVRFGPIPPRIKDMGVLLDLGSHEIDLLNYLSKTQPEILYSHTSSCSNNNFEDYAYVSLKYGDMYSHIETSWLPNYKLRFINLYAKDSFSTLDYGQQKLKYYRAPPKSKIESGSWQDILWLARNVNTNMSVTQEEPLKLELQCFVKSIKKGKLVKPLCSCEEALEVLRIVEEALRVARA